MAMVISVDNLFRERKYPFIFSLFILLIILLFSFIFFFDSQSSPLIFTSDLTTTQPAISLSSPPLLSADSSPPPPPSTTTVPNPSALASRVVVLPNATTEVADLKWRKCAGSVAVDYIPCLDNLKAIKALKWRRHMEHKERHCPSPSSRCLIPIPRGYKVPVLWPKSRDMTLPMIKWGKRTRVILDVGCGVASFGGYLLGKDVITMSFAPKDQHEAQIQFALERGIPATLSVIGTQRLTFPDNVYDLIHCARCRVHWDGDGGKPLMELNRVLRPGGFFIWSATPVYRTDEKDQNVWNSMVALTESICWKVVAKSFPSTGIGFVIYQKPVSSSCYERRKDNKPPTCDQNRWKNMSWYTPLDTCLPPLPLPSQGSSYKWPMLWPKRLSSKPLSLSTEPDAEEIFYEDTKHWSALVSDVYVEVLAINWSSVRNIMDMNAGYGGFAAALIGRPLWVMNVIPIHGPDTLSIIFDRGLIGIYHDWCESLNTYPRSYDMLHASFLLGNLTQRCDIIDVAVEMDRILRPGGFILVQDTMEMTNKLTPILHSLHWSIALHQEQFLIGTKGFWRPDGDFSI